MTVPAFRPVAWARGPHLQTVLGSLLPHGVPDLPWETHDLVQPDGDVLKAHLLPGGERVAYLFHGLGGSARAGYIRRAAARLHARGWTVWALDHRGAGAGKGLAARPYHSGATGDLSALLALGRRRQPRAHHVAVGYSISGNMLLLLMGHPGPGEVQPDAALAVNPPCDLDACSHRLGRGFNRVYDQRFLRELVREVQLRSATGRIPWVDFEGVRSLRDFDAAYTAPAAGFRDRAHYYEACGCGPHLAAIQRPTVILTAEDDPIAPASELLACPRSPQVHLHVEAQGGHMGYLAPRGGDLPDGRWLEAYLVDTLEELAR